MSEHPADTITNELLTWMVMQTTLHTMAADKFAETNDDRWRDAAEGSWRTMNRLLNR